MVIGGQVEVQMSADPEEGKFEGVIMLQTQHVYLLHCSLSWVDFTYAISIICILVLQINSFLGTVWLQKLALFTINFILFSYTESQTIHVI
jgi:hypothetical protein